MGRCHHVDSVVHSIKVLLLIAKCQSLSNKLDMLIYCTLQMHVQQAMYANELHVNVRTQIFRKQKRQGLDVTIETITCVNKNCVNSEIAEFLSASFLLSYTTHLDPSIFYLNDSEKKRTVETNRFS